MTVSEKINHSIQQAMSDVFFRWAEENFREKLEVSITIALSEAGVSSALTNAIGPGLSGMYRKVWSEFFDALNFGQILKNIEKVNMQKRIEELVLEAIDKYGIGDTQDVATESSTEMA